MLTPACGCSARLVASVSETLSTVSTGSGAALKDEIGRPRRARRHLNVSLAYGRRRLDSLGGARSRRHCDGSPGQPNRESASLPYRRIWCALAESRAGIVRAPRERPLTTASSLASPMANPPRIAARGTDAAYNGWKNDMTAGRTRIMSAATTADVTARSAPAARTASRPVRSSRQESCCTTATCRARHRRGQDGQHSVGDW
jgi:hypothetical protein